MHKDSKSFPGIKDFNMVSSSADKPQQDTDATTQTAPITES